MNQQAVAAEKAFNDKQVQEIQSIVHQYLVTHPEVLLEASKALQEKQQQSMMKQATGAIEKNSKALFDSNSPMVGNPKGDVTIVEFFDYQCVHCKKMSPVIDTLLQQNKNLRVIYKEFPIFGKSSDYAARAALAAQKQDKYQAFHNALISKEQRLSKAVVIKTADEVGLNVNKLKADMKSPEIDKAIKENMHLAESLHLMGTPAFIVAQTPKGEFKNGNKTFFVPGAASQENLQNLIEQVK